MTIILLPELLLGRPQKRVDVDRAALQGPGKGSALAAVRPIMAVPLGLPAVPLLLARRRARASRERTTAARSSNAPAKAQCRARTASAAYLGRRPARWPVPVVDQVRSVSQCQARFARPAADDAGCQGLSVVISSVGLG
jgi:hypothetical protein